MTLGNNRSISAILLLIVTIFYFIQPFTSAYGAELSQAEEEYLKKKGTIVFVSQTHYPPFEFLGADGDHTGMCIDLARWIATEFGFKVHFTNTSFKQAQDEVLSGNADILTSLFYSQKRDEVFDFTDVIFEVPASIFVLAQRPDIKEIMDLQGKVIAIQAGDYAEEFLAATNITCTFKYTKNFAEATDLVIAGQADALIGDEQIVLYHIFSNDLAKGIKKVGDPLYIGKNCMGAKDPNPILVGILNKGIKLAQKKGVFDQIYKKWIGIQYFSQISWMKQYYPYFLILVGGILLVAILGWFWNIKLRQMVVARTLELSNSEKTLRTILTTSPLGIGLIRGRILEWHNPAMSRMLGYAPGELEGQDIKILYQNYGLQRSVEQKLNSGFQGGDHVVIETQWVRKDRSVFDCQLRYTLLKLDDEKSMTIVIAEDITERKQAESALEESEEKYRGIVENAVEGIFQSTPKGSFISVNPAFAKMLGYASPEELISTISDITTQYYLIPEDRRQYQQLLQKTGVVEGFEFRARCKDGSYIWVSNSTRACFDQDGNIFRYEGVVQDITARKLAEEEKFAAQKIAAEQGKQALVGQIAGKMAHDFNNILGIIMGNTELSLMECEDAQIRKTLELIFEQTIRGKNLTKNLVAFAKDQELKQVFFSISEKMDLVLNLMRKDLEGIELLREESLGIPELLADPGMIEHAFVNLIQNAIHAVSKVESPRVIIRTHRRDNNICFEIEDNGCGISKEHLADIYGPSFTLKGSRDVTNSYEAGIKGTGYGMSNVKKYIEQHKGMISVASELGTGTKFTILLPIIEKELTPEEKTEIRKEKVHFEKYILLVEDETAISDVQYRILTQEPCNHKVDIANNGQVAMDLFERNTYDLVSLDYVLPGNINGMDVYTHIRTTNKEIPILFISGNIEFLESINELKQKDARIDHLSKPCQNKEYVTSINRLFENVWVG